MGLNPLTPNIARREPMLSGTGFACVRKQQYKYHRLQTMLGHCKHQSRKAPAVLLLAVHGHVTGHRD